MLAPLMTPPRPLLLLALLLASGCSFHDDLPATAQVRCNEGDTCPVGTQCVVAAHLCVRTGDPALAPLQLSNPALTPTLGKQGSTFQLTFDLDGSPNGPPSAAAAGDGGRFPFLCGACVSGHCACLAQLAADAGLPDGQYAVAAQAVSLLGIAATPLQAGTLTLKSTPPPPPDLAEDGGLHLFRAPWGARPTIGQAQLSLDSTGPAIPEAGTLVVYGDAKRTITLAQAAVTPGALPPLDLPLPDRPQVWVDLVDIAGNRAPGGPFAVKNVTWVASLGNKTAGDVATNPHACYGRGVHDGSLFQGDDDAREQDAATGPTGAPASPLPGAGRWRKRQDGTPALTYGSAPSYDSAHSTLVTYGSGAFTGNQLWAFDGTDWSRKVNEQAVPNPTYYYTAMAYDARRGKMVLFGDGPLDTARCSTWELTGTTWALVDPCIAFADGGPSPDFPALGAYTAMTYDEANQAVVLLDSNRELWRWNGATWTRVPADTRPNVQPYRGRFPYTSMVWQAQPGGRGQLITAGGVGPDGGSDLNVIWVGAQGPATVSWTEAERDQCDPDKPGCYQNLLAIDPATNDVLLASARADNTAELWRWNGSLTTHFEKVGDLPPGIIRGFNIDLARSDTETRFLYFAGKEASEPQRSLDQSWSCSVTLQTPCVLLHQAQSLDQPPARQSASMAFGPDGTALMYGGEVSLAGLMYDDTWQWTGTDWVDQFAKQPGPRAFTGLSYVEQFGTWALVGGSGIDAGENGTDRAAQAVRQDVWLWDGADWYLAADHLPGLANGAPAMTVAPDLGPLVADPVISRLVPAEDGGVALVPLAASATEDFTGYLVSTLRGQLYALGTLRVTDVSDPFDNTLYALDPLGRDTKLIHDDHANLSFVVPIYDEAAARLLFFGTQSVGSWDGTRLSQVETANPSGEGSPSARTFPATGYDATRGRTVLFGGAGLGGIPLAETWEFDLAAERPAEVCHFHMDAAGTAAVPTRVRVQVQAGAGRADGVPSGVSLQLWRRGRFESVARCDAGACPLTAPGELSVDVPGAQVPLLLRDLGLLGLAVVPDVPNGTSTSEVVVRQAQLVVDYRLP
jgi:hypothetical protein